MRVKIISDSTCDLSPALLERYDIAVTPLCVIKDGKDFHDGVDITPADIFAHVDGGGDLCSTSAVSQYEYGEMFARYTNEYDAVVQITIGANFSCCYQNACAAAQEYANVFVVDSENLSTGQGLWSSRRRSSPSRAFPARRSPSACARSRRRSRRAF